MRQISNYGNVMIRQYLLLLMGAGVSALASLFVGIMTSTESLAIFLILQVLAGLGACIFALIKASFYQGASPAGPVAIKHSRIPRAPPRSRP